LRGFGAGVYAGIAGAGADRFLRIAGWGRLGILHMQVGCGWGCVAILPTPAKDESRGLRSRRRLRRRRILPIYDAGSGYASSSRPNLVLPSSPSSCPHPLPLSRSSV
jgi:hypothetical protein